MSRRLLCFVLVALSLAGCRAVATQEPVSRVYSDDVTDPWNRLFSIMFTRTVTHRKTSEFADAGPFEQLGERAAVFLPFSVSTRTFERFEDGDRAIAPFYPSLDFMHQGPPSLRDPRLETFGRMLQDALADTRPRTPVARVLMQSDLWAVFDRLGSGSPHLPALARMISKLALTSDEIAALPDQFAHARQADTVPDVLSPGSRWQEIVWFESRMHDRDVGFRQAARVFLLPAATVTDRQSAIDDLRLQTGGPHRVETADLETRIRRAFGQIDGAALLMQLLTLDTRGDVVPTRLFYTVQTRLFSEGGKRTVAAEHELSRKAMLALERTRGVRTFRGADPAYLPSGGTDYGFASPQLSPVREPILGTLDSRCAACHGIGPHLFTFSLTGAQDDRRVRLLTQPNQDRALYVAAQKKTREDYKRLRALLALSER